MLLKSVFYDKSCTYWTNNYDYNIMFLHSQERFINDLVRNRGYIYLNQIFENLGIAWDSKEDNICVNNDADRNKYVEFEVFKTKGNLLMINIYDNV